MQHTQSIENSPVGGRISSPKFRESLQQSENFTGLATDTNRFHALNLIKQVGREGGFTPELIELLDYYLWRTSEIDWTEGNQPICYQAVISTALDLGISERQVNKREKALNLLGVLTWEDSSNFKRYGMRDRETGVILYAYGVDLSPLAFLVPELERKVAEKTGQKERWNQLKRQIHGLRAKIRAMLAEAALIPELTDFVVSTGQAYDDIAYSIRTYHTHGHLETLLDRHRLVHEALLETLKEYSKAEDNDQITQDSSSKDAIEFCHIHNTNNPISNKLDYSRAQPDTSKEAVVDSTITKGTIESAASPQPLINTKFHEDFGKITLKQIIGACSDRFRDRLPRHSGRAMTWDDVFEAAYSLLPELGIHKSAWNAACGELSGYAAAICVMIIDQKAQDPTNPVRNPGGYLRQMTARAGTGELNLLGSIFGMLKRGEKNHDA